QNGARSHVIEAREEIHESCLAGAARADQSDDVTFAGDEGDIAKNMAGIGLIDEADFVETNVAGKSWQNPRAGLIQFFFLFIEISEDLRAGALHGLQLLINVADTLEGHVGVEEREDEGEEIAFGHGVNADLVTSVEKQEGNGDGANDIHDGRRHDGSANPAHV